MRHAGFLSIAYINGGPVSATWGWITVSIASVLMAFSIAEIVSAYPIAGGPYFWCALPCRCMLVGVLVHASTTRACCLPLTRCCLCLHVCAGLSRVLELTKNDPDWMLTGWITGSAICPSALPC